MAIAAVRQIRKSRPELHPAEKHEVRNIDVASIKVGKRMRPLGDITALVESIKEVGLLNPILITRDRRLISGLHRLAAFKALGRTHIPCIILSVSQQEAQLREIDENLARNDLTVLQRGEHLLRRKELYEALHPETRQGGDRGNQYSGGRKCQKDMLSFCQTAATLTGQSSKTAQRLVRIAKLLTPETKRLLRGTEWADNQRALIRLCKLTPEMQERVARKSANGESRDIYAAIAMDHRDKLMARRCGLPLTGTEYRLLHGDFRKVGHEIPSGSVDLVLTDAPYESGYLHLFEPLSLFAHRVLKDGGSLVCMMGQSYLPQVLNDLSAHLRYHWVIAVLVDGRQTLLKARRIFAAHKSMLWFVKGSYRGHAIQDVVRSDKYDKRYHDHGQCESEFSEVIKRLTEDGDTVLDCFVGGGTTAAAALKLGRRIIGIDIERKHIEITRRRIESVLKLCGRFEDGRGGRHQL
jgi:16S rRNA G966 N2-methylase RsmD